MPYESGFLKKCQALAASHLKGTIDLDSFAKKANDLYASREKWTEYVMDVCQAPKYVELSSKGAEYGEQGLREWEEGFRCWFDYIANEDSELVDEGLLAMRKGNDLFNAARDAFLDVSEDTNVRFTL